VDRPHLVGKRHMKMYSAAEMGNFVKYFNP